MSVNRGQNLPPLRGEREIFLSRFCTGMEGLILAMEVDIEVDGGVGSHEEEQTPHSLHEETTQSFGHSWLICTQGSSSEKHGQVLCAIYKRHHLPLDSVYFVRVLDRHHPQTPAIDEYAAS